LKSRIALPISVLACTMGLASFADAATLAALGREADLIALARATSITVDGAGGVEVQLDPVTLLKGTAPATPIRARLAPSALMAQNAGPSVRKPPASLALWFMRVTPQQLELMPSMESQYTENEAFWPVPEWWSPSKSASLNEQLYSALSAWYLSLRSATLKDDYAFLANFGSGAPAESVGFLDVLISSTELDTRVIGFAAAIQEGSDEAVAQLAEYVGTLRGSKKFYRITDALSRYYQPHGSASIEPLRRLITLRSDAPGLDLAVARALARIASMSYVPQGGPGPALFATSGTPSKEVLPALIDVLNSRDEAAQRGAARLLGEFAARANENGEITQGLSGPHPYLSDETVRYTPGRDSKIATHDYVAFWKNWWEQNRGKLGFSSVSR
jgi:hypothetical protein